ncbi:hypothetical protein Y032_0003g1615 [Ancylostoma ceylanicum]|nr:hypothetical protein Y032_0003g1615 [Ancylostoma ceylanicum]
MDVFCGTLTVFEQQRFGTNSIALSSQETSDLKQCLELCCSVMNCRGVTFTGVIVPHTGQPNCLLVACRGDSCEMNQRAEYSDGLISVLINRTQMQPILDTNVTLLENATTTIQSTTSTTSTMAPLPATTAAITETTSEKASERSVPQSLAPVWAVGLAIVIAVVCVGLNLGLLSAYICYRRQKSRKQTAQISANKGPTLHAYNPTL